MPRSLNVLIFGAIGAVAAFLFFDHPLGVWFRQQPFSGDVRTLIRFGELFGHGFGPVLASLLIYVLDQANRHQIPRVLACAFASGLAAALVKVFLSRIRPRAFDFSHTIDQTFQGLIWFREISDHYQSLSDYQSFPSAHTATAVGLALALSRLYPHGRRLFAGFAVLVALQRMVSEAHWLSDTICGAALAFLVAGFFLSDGPLARRFDRQERKTPSKAGCG